MRKSWLAFLAFIALAGCLASPALYFLGKLSARSYKLSLLLASLAWFVLATLWAGTRKKADDS